jgi:TonB family protein
VRFFVTLDATGRIAETRFGGVALQFPPGTASDIPTNQALTRAMIRSSEAAMALWRYETPQAPVTFMAVFTFTSGAEPTFRQEDPPPESVVEPWPAAEAAGARRLTPGPGVTMPQPVKKPNPAYSAEAKAARVQGQVTLELVVGVDGKVTDARVIRSIPLLDAQALETGRRWEFTPATVGGKPVAAIVMVEFGFNLR